MIIFMCIDCYKEADSIKHMPGIKIFMRDGYYTREQKIFQFSWARGHIRAITLANHIAREYRNRREQVTKIDN